MASAIFGLQSSVVIPSTGSIDYGATGVVFEDDFESGDFSAWTGVRTKAGDIATVEQVNPYEGDYNAHFLTNGTISGIEEALSYYTVSPERSEIYARGYYYVSSGLPLDDNDDRFGLITIRDTTSGWLIVNFRIQRVHGVDQFFLLMTSGKALWVNVTTDAVYPQPNTWYCFELYFKVHSTEGEGRVWINGVEHITITGKDTSHYGNIDQIRFGLVSTNVQHHVDVSVDDCVISSQYIGPSSIFEDGFESGDFSRWTSTHTTTGDNATVVEIDPYEGNYHARFQTNGITSGVEWSVSSCSVSPETSEVYACGYFYIAHGLPLDDNDDRFALITIYDPTSRRVQAILRIIKVGGVEKFQLNIASGDSYFAAVTDAVYPQEGVWYCFELYFKVHSTEGEGRVWINGVEHITITGKDTDNYGNIKLVRYGLASVNVQHAVDLYCDAVVVSTEYVGPLSKYSFAVVGNAEEVSSLNNIYWMLGNLSISYKTLLPSEVTDEGVFSDVDGVISFVSSVEGTLVNSTAVRAFAERHVVISDIYDFCYLYYPSFKTSCQLVSEVSTVTYLMNWGSFRTGDRPELRRTNGDLKVVSATALEGITKIAQYNSTYVAFFHMAGLTINSGYYVMDLYATRDSTLTANNWHLFPALNYVHELPIGKYARWLADGLNWYSLDWVNNFMNKLASQNPTLVEMRSIGTTVQGRSINALFIGKGGRYILVDGAMHGDEKTATVGCLRTAELLVEYYNRGDSYWQSRLSNYKIIIVPVSNPDGYFANSRNNANGINLNRNYPPDGWKQLTEPESLAFANLLGNYTPTIFINLHTQIFQTLFMHDSSSKLILPYDTFAWNLWRLANTTYVSLRHWGNNRDGKPYGQINKIDMSSIQGPVYEYAWWKYQTVSCLLEFYHWNPAYNLLGQEYYLSVIFTAIQNYDKNQDFLAYSTGKISNTNFTANSYKIDFDTQELKAEFVLNIYVGDRGKPVTVVIDGVEKGEGDGWWWSPKWQLKDAVHVTEAKNVVSLNW